MALEMVKMIYGAGWLERRTGAARTYGRDERWLRFQMGHYRFIIAQVGAEMCHYRFIIYKVRQQSEPYLCDQEYGVVWFMKRNVSDNTLHSSTTVHRY